MLRKKCAADDASEYYRSSVRGAFTDSSRLRIRLWFSSRRGSVTSNPPCLKM
jgi:hypothetical protein